MKCLLEKGTGLKQGGCELSLREDLLEPLKMEGWGKLHLQQMFGCRTVDDTGVFVLEGQKER